MLNAANFVEDIAELCHEVNRAYCACMGDTSHQPWDLAPQWVKTSAMLGVKYHLENPFAKPEDSHISWLEHKEKDGWVYGEFKDEEAKTHPCFMPYEMLPIEQRAKDHIFTAIVKTLAKREHTLEIPPR